MRAGGEGFVIDSPVYPDELDALPSVLEQAGFPVSACWPRTPTGTTCSAGSRSPTLSLGLCGDVSAARWRPSPGAAQRSLRDFDQEHYVEQRRAAGARPRCSRCRSPAGWRSARPASSSSCIRPTGHTADGAAYVIPWLEVLVCGDYLSPVEIPMISDGRLGRGLPGHADRMRPLVEATQNRRSPATEPR